MKEKGLVLAAQVFGGKSVSASLGDTVFRFVKEALVECRRSRRDKLLPPLTASELAGRASARSHGNITPNAVLRFLQKDITPTQKQMLAGLGWPSSVSGNNKQRKDASERKPRTPEQVQALYASALASLRLQVKECTVAALADQVGIAPWMVRSYCLAHPEVAEQLADFKP